MPASLPPSDGPPFRNATGRTISSEKAAFEDGREADVAYPVGVRPRAGTGHKKSRTRWFSLKRACLSSVFVTRP
jgi:hypothetical protein